MNGGLAPIEPHNNCVDTEARRRADRANERGDENRDALILLRADVDRLKMDVTTLAVVREEMAEIRTDIKHILDGLSTFKQAGMASRTQQQGQAFNIAIMLAGWVFALILFLLQK